MVRVDPIPSVNRAACADREATPSGRMSLLRKSALTRLAAPWHSLCGDRPSGDLAIRHLHLMSRTVAQGTARMACVGIHFATRMMRWLKRTCSRHASVACAAQQSAKGCRFGSCAAGRIGVATCLSILNLKQPCVRPTPDIPIPSRLKKPRDTFPSSPLRSCALTPRQSRCRFPSQSAGQGPRRSNIELRTMQNAGHLVARDYCPIGFPKCFGGEATLGPLK